jgi:NAD-dependent deacetylase
MTYIPGMFTKSSPESKDVSVSDIFRSAKHVVVLTGAGISVEGGVPTFRGKGGLWDRYDVDKYATAEALANRPEDVWEMHHELRKTIAECKPNPAHYAIAKMEEKFPDLKVVTQNVDNYHQDAGSANVIELHGNVWKDVCTQEETVTINKTLPLQELPPKCENCGAMLRPGVVFFGEALDAGVLGTAIQAAEFCDLMFVIGTSAVVQPAASLPFIAKQHNAFVVEVNIEATSVSSIADKAYYGKAGEVLPELWDEFLLDNK